MEGKRLFTEKEKKILKHLREKRKGKL